MLSVTAMQLGSLIRRAARQFGDAPCLTEDERSISYVEFDAATDRLGNALLALGLQAGDRVGVLLPNSIDCLIAYYALAKSGLVRVSLNTRETLADHQYKLNNSGCRGVIHNAVEEPGCEFNIGSAQLEQMIAQGDAAPCAVDRALSDPLRLGFTGGTTGQPKAVTLTNQSELWEIAAFLMDLMPDIRPGDSFLHAAPIAHASGAFFLPCLIRGAHSVIMPKFDPGEFLHLAEQTRASLTFLVPTMLAMIMQAPQIDNANLNFRRIAYGASPISPRLLERAEARFGRIFAQTYGQAESPMAITCLRPEDHDRSGSCGRPYPFVDVAVFNNNDQPLGPNEIGEIVCRGPQTMAYYWDNPEATEKAFRGGWLHTGDIGRMDEDGFFSILDRKNDMLISGGFNVYPREVEDVLMACDGVVEAAVIGLPDEKWGDRIHAVVVGQPDLDTDAIMAYARAQLAKYKQPKGIEVWPELPKSGANKILRRAVRERLLVEKSHETQRRAEAHKEEK